MRRIKALFINDTDGRENVGCRLTSRLLKQNLTQAFALNGLELQLIPAPWRFGRSVGIQIASRLLMADMRKPSLAGMKALAAHEYGEYCVRTLGSYDLAIFQPEGTVNEWDGPMRMLRLLSLPLLFGKAYTAPLITINGTFPLFSDERSQLIKTLINWSVHFSVRDQFSAEAYKVNFVPDAACSWQRANIKPLSDRTHLLITTSAGLNRQANIETARRAIDHCKHSGLLPLVLTKQWQDLLPLRDTVLELGGEFCYYEELEDAAEKISKCRLHIGGRYHMAILCACMDVPSFLVAANTHKNEWLARDSQGITLLANTGPIAETIEVELQKLSHGDVMQGMRQLGEKHTLEVSKFAEIFSLGQLTKASPKDATSYNFNELSTCWPGGSKQLIQRTLSGLKNKS